MEQEENENNTLLHNINNRNTNLLQKTQYLAIYNYAGNLLCRRFFIQPDFKPNGYIMEVTGKLNQDVTLTILGTQPVSEYSKKRRVGYNHHIKLSKGAVSFSYNAELYVDELKVVVSGSDFALYPNPDSKGTLHCAPLGDIKIKITLQ